MDQPIKEKTRLLIFLVYSSTSQLCVWCTVPWKSICLPSWLLLTSWAEVWGHLTSHHTFIQADLKLLPQSWKRECIECIYIYILWFLFTKDPSPNMTKTPCKKMLRETAWEIRSRKLFNVAEWKHFLKEKWVRIPPQHSGNFLLSEVV